MKRINKYSLLLVTLFIGPILAKAQDLSPTLQNLIHQGISKSHTVKAAAYDTEKALVTQDLAKSVFIPKITINAGYTRLNDDIKFDDNTQNLLIGSQKLLIKEALGIPFNYDLPEDIPLEDVPNIQDKNILKSSADLEWVIFSGFGAHNALEAIKHKQASMEYKGLIQKDKVALQIIETYDQLALVASSNDVLNSSANFLAKQDEYVSKAIENGFAIPLDRKKIEIAQQQLIGKQLQFKNSRKLLIEVMHQLTGESKDVLNAINYQLPITASKIDLNESQVRNEVLALEEAEKATQFKAKMQKSSFIPKVAIKGHYEFIDEYLSLLDPKWYVGIGVKWNIFDGFESKIKSKQTTIDAHQYHEKMEEAKELISLSVMQNKLNYEAAIQNTAIVQKEVELSAQSYDMTIKQYKNGLSTINDALEALNDLEKAKFKLQKSYYDERRAFIDLLHASGNFNY